MHPTHTCCRSMCGRGLCANGFAPDACNFGFFNLLCTCYLPSCRNGCDKAASRVDGVS